VQLCPCDILSGIVSAGYSRISLTARFSPLISPSNFAEELVECKLQSHLETRRLRGLTALITVDAREWIRSEAKRPSFLIEF